MWPPRVGRRRQLSSIVTTLEHSGRPAFTSPAIRSLVRQSRQPRAAPLNIVPADLGRQCSVSELHVYLSTVATDAVFGADWDKILKACRRPSTRVAASRRARNLRAELPLPRCVVEADRHVRTARPSAQVATVERQDLAAET